MVNAFSVILVFLVLQPQAQAQSPLAPSSELGVQEANLLFKHLVNVAELETQQLPIGSVDSAATSVQLQGEKVPANNEVQPQSTGRPIVDAQQASISSSPVETPETPASNGLNAAAEPGIPTENNDGKSDPLNKLLELEDPSSAVGSTELSGLQSPSPDLWMLSTFVVAFVFLIFGIGGIFRLRQRAISSGIGQIRVLSRTALSKESGLAVIELEINERPERYLIGFGGGSPRLVANLTGGGSPSNLSSFPDGVGALFGAENRQSTTKSPETNASSTAMHSAELRDLWSQEPKPEVNVEVDFNGSESFEDFLNRIGRLDASAAESADEISANRSDVGNIEANRTEIFDYLAQRTGNIDPDSGGTITEPQSHSTSEQMASNSPANSLFGELLKDDQASQPSRGSGYSGSNVRRGIEAYRQPQDVDNSPFQRMSIGGIDDNSETTGDSAVADEDPWDSGFRRIAAQRGRKPGQ